MTIITEIRRILWSAFILLYQNSRNEVMNNVVQLEAFEAPLRGRQVRWFLVPGAPIAQPPGFQEQTIVESPPFQRRILITSPQSSEAWKLVDRQDAILVPTTGQDWSLALTLILNQPPPCLVVLTPELKIPPVFLQKCAAQPIGKAPTMIHFQWLTMPPPPPAITFSATFLPPSRNLEDGTLEATQAVLQNLLSSDVLRNFSLKDALRDLKSAGATLVISNIGETEPNLYWQQAVELKSKGRDILASVLQTLLHRDH